MAFFNIPTKSHYSIGHAFGSVKAVMKKAIKAGHSAACVVDIHNMGSVIEMIGLSKDKKFFKDIDYQRNHFPIIVGATVNACEDLLTKNGDNPSNPVILLAKNQVGYSNICYLSSIGTHPEEHYYLTPRVSVEEIHNNKDGVIAVDGSFNGYVSNLIRSKQIPQAIAYLKGMKEAFGDDFYILIDLLDVSKKYIASEKKMLQTSINDMVEINKMLIQMAKNLQIKTVVGFSSEMPDEDDLPYLEIHMKNVLKIKGAWSAQEPRYLMSEEKIRERAKEKFPFITDEHMDEMIANVNEVQSKTENIDLVFQNQIPALNYGEHPLQERRAELEEKVFTWAARAEQEDDRIKGLVETIKKDEGLLFGFMVAFYHNKVNLDHPVYRYRMLFEMRDTQRNGKIKLVDYYLFLEEAYRVLQNVKYFATKHNIPLPEDAPNAYLRGFGRGSAGGSLLAYCFNITELDPIAEELLWERFLTADRLGVIKPFSEKVKPADEKLAGQ